MKATTVRGETKGQVVRRGLLRVLAGGEEWTSWDDILDGIRAVSSDDLQAELEEWFGVALREAIALGDVERHPKHRHCLRLTDQGLKAQAIAALEAVEAPDAHP